jgi:RimJ/RimL family protein N-acetyltransferase
MTPDPYATADDAASRAHRRPVDRRHLAAAPAAIPSRAPIDGNRVVLEPPESRHDHLEPLWTATHADDDGRRTWEYMSYGPFPTLDEFDDWYAARASSTDPLWWAVTDATLGSAVGMAALLRIEPDNGVIELGHIWFVPSVRATPPTTEALYLLMRRAIELGYRRLEWKCDARNMMSRRAALRLGFRYEGVFLDHMVVKDHNRDTAWYSLTREEWPPVQQALEAWLSPENFDIAGRQRSRLRDLTRALW